MRFIHNGSKSNKFIQIENQSFEKNMMIQKKRYISLFLMILFSFVLLAQDTKQDRREQKRKMREADKRRQEQKDGNVKLDGNTKKIARFALSDEEKSLKNKAKSGVPLSKIEKRKLNRVYWKEEKWKRTIEKEKHKKMLRMQSPEARERIKEREKQRKKERRQRKRKAKKRGY